MRGWAERTPADFVISLKVPKTVTHERYLEDCAAEWTRFLRLLEPLMADRSQYVRKNLGPYAIGDGLLRLSVGIEAAEALCADLEQALRPLG